MKKSQFVLIVDDDRDWAESVADLFLAYGYEAEVIANGKAAVEHARRHDFDIAFMDVRAADSCREIRQRRPHVRVLLTGTGLLEKPLAFERMLEAVETAA